MSTTLEGSNVLGHKPSKWMAGISEGKEAYEAGFLKDTREPGVLKKGVGQLIWETLLT